MSRAINNFSDLNSGARDRSSQLQLTRTELPLHRYDIGSVLSTAISIPVRDKPLSRSDVKRDRDPEHVQKARSIEIRSDRDYS
jgi:hypothetical protein